MAVSRMRAEHRLSGARHWGSRMLMGQEIVEVAALGDLEW